MSPVVRPDGRKELPVVTVPLVIHAREEKPATQLDAVPVVGAVPW